ncbi:type II toxin-antitoxin system VapC family toxin [Chloroflexi bacterium TSY]|nr:type II toxin-antitoxin system VapC family toxin [Chloroflexi bacterium TSY]
MIYLLDTCVISELVSKQPNSKVVKWIDNIQDEYTYLSVITLGEIQRGIEKLPESKRKQILVEWLQSDLLIRFQDNILPIDIPVIFTWGKFVAQLELAGRKLPAMDSLIAATALHHKLHLVTRNEKDFLGTNVMLLNPWSSS